MICVGGGGRESGLSTPSPSFFPPFRWRAPLLGSICSGIALDKSCTNVHTSVSAGMPLQERVLCLYLFRHVILASEKKERK